MDSAAIDNATDKARVIGEIDAIFEQIAQVSDEKETAYDGVLVLRCPRCGSRLTYTPMGMSWKVRCERDGCVDFAVRGI